MFNISEGKPIEIEFTTTKYGTQQLNYGGHRYNRHVQRDAITYWRCSQYGLLKCRARIKTVNNTFYDSAGSHNHEIIKGTRKYGTAKRIKSEIHKIKLEYVVAEAFGEPV